VENIISMNDMGKKEILDILELARKIEDCSEEEKLKFLRGKINKAAGAKCKHSARCEYGGIMFTPSIEALEKTIKLH